MITPQNARKEMFDLVNTCWNDHSLPIIGYVPEIRWQGIEEAEFPGADKYWMRASTNNVSTRQRGHQMPEAGLSKVVYDTFGFITLQIFAPMKSPVSWANGELLSELGQGMFMATETGGAVWFRNPRILQLNNDGTWYRWNVIADYRFSHVKGF